MVSKLLRIPALLTCLGLVACDKSEKSAKDERFDKDNYFSEVEITMDLNTLENEMAKGETDFLRSFAKDDFPWQHWDQATLEKSSKSQRPILLFIGGVLGGDSRPIGQTLSQTPKFKSLLSKNYVCAVADIQAQPELGLLAYHLSNEHKRPTSFPTLVWMSHKGAPIAWISISQLSPHELEVVLGNGSAMVNDTWGQSSEYAVSNSLADNQSRRDRLSFKPSPDAPPAPSRDDFFKNQTRLLSTLYSAGDRDLDYIGGLLPISSLELLALGSASNKLSEQYNKRCREAVTEVVQEVITGGLKDHLDGSYFYARRTSDWSLPAFSKSIVTQAKVCQMLIQTGTLTDNPDFIREGLETLKLLEENWLQKSLAISSPLGDSDLPGKFLWDWPNLEKAIGPELVPIAVEGFSLQKEGNIPSEVDPLANYFQLNSLRFQKSAAELASKLGKSEPEITAALDEIKMKMLTHRNEHCDFITESVFSCTDLAEVLRAQISAATVTGDPANLERARKMAARISTEYLDPDKGLARLPLSGPFVPARASDFASFAVALIDLHQATLEPAHLALAEEIISQAIHKLVTPDGLIAENSLEESTIPLQIVQPAMVFSDSSLGLIDLVITRLAGITGSKQYDSLRLTITKTISPMAEVAVINHTDFISTCAYGDEPLVALFQGSAESENGKAQLKLLNSKQYISFLAIRDANATAGLKNLPPTSGDASVVLLKGDVILGQAKDAGDLAEQLETLLFRRK